MIGLGNGFAGGRPRGGIGLIVFLSVYVLAYVEYR